MLTILYAFLIKVWFAIGVVLLKLEPVYREDSYGGKGKVYFIGL